MGKTLSKEQQMEIEWENLRQLRPDL